MLRKHLCLLFSAISALGLLLFAAPEALAQFSISPTIVEMKAYPGGLQTFTLSIGNSGKTALICKMGVSAMVVRGGGLPVEVDDAPRSCKDWITIETETFTLSPKEGKRVVCRVRAPRGTTGGYYAIISCHGVPTSSVEDKGDGGGLRAGIRFSHRVLAVVMLTVPGADLRAVIEAGEPLVSQDEKRRAYTLQIPIRNRGNIHDRIMGSVEIRSDAGQLVERFQLEAGRGFVFPEHERLFTTKGAINLPDGVYVARVRVNLYSGRSMRNAFPFMVKNGRPVVTEVTDEVRAELEKESAGFAVSSPEIQVMLRPGARRAQAVKVVNLTRKTLRLRAGIMEWVRDPEGWDLVFEENAPHGRSARDWISLRQPEIELRPLTKLRIPLMITLPKGATGETYAAVTFDRVDIQLDASPKGRARRSTLIRVEAQGTAEPKAEIIRFTAARKPNGVIELTARIKNTGNICFTPDVAFRIVDSLNNTAGKTRPTESPSFVQAGGESLISAEWSQVLDPGEYTAVVTLRFDPNLPPIIRRTKFIAPKVGDFVKTL